VEFDRAPFGIIGLETALGLAITLLCENAVAVGARSPSTGRRRGQRAPGRGRPGSTISLTRIVELFATNPERIVGLKDRGALTPGAIADVTIFDPKKKWTYDVGRSRSKSRNSPFDGWKLTGAAVATIVSGKIVYRG